MRILLLLACMFCICCSPLLAQHEADTWYFGDNTGLTFRNDSTISISGPLSSAEGCAAISDTGTGEVLFYTNGEQIWNRKHQIMTNGDSLLSGTSSSQGVLIVPDPGNTKQYYVFTVPDLTSGGTPTTTKLHYSIVNLQNPDGEVILKNIALVDSVSEKLTGTISCNGKDFWVVVHRQTQNIFYSYRVTASGIDTIPIISTYANVPVDHTAGCMKISPDGTKLAIASYKISEETRPYLAMFNFDNQSGSVDNQILLSNSKSTEMFYGVSFSPDNSKLYAIGRITIQSTTYQSAIFQFEVGSSKPEEVFQSRFVFPVRLQSLFASSLQLGPDKKLYLSSIYRPFLDVIEHPNVKGYACKYQVDAIHLTGNSFLGLPNFMDYIFNDSIQTDTIYHCKNSAPTPIGIAPRIGYTYQWEPANGLSSPTVSNPLLTASTTTKYVLTQSGVMGCKRLKIFIVIVDSLSAGTEQVSPICKGESVQLRASGGRTYSWSPTESLDNPNIPNPIAAPKVDTKYRVVVSNGICSDTAYVEVSILQFSGAHAGTDKTVCPGGTAELGEKPTAGHQYNWQPTTNIDDPTKANPTFTATTIGTTEYILTVSNSIGCTEKDTVLVTVGNIVAKISNDTAICSGTSVQLLASGGANYTWTPTTGLSNPSIENPIASPTTTTTYKVKVSSGTCEDSAFVTITVNPQPTAKAGQDKTLCIGASTEIGEAAQAGFSYQWQPTNGLDDATKANPTASPTSTTQYILTVSGNGGCTSSDTVLMTIGTIKAIVSNDTSICEGASAKLLASGGAKYEWSPSTGLDNTSIATPTANPTSTTKYKVLVSSGTCIDSNFVIVTILPPPTANAGEDKPICIGESTQIGTPAEAGNSYAWSPSTGLSSPTASQTIASPTTTTTYTLTVTNPAGCVKSDEVIVTLNPQNERSFTLKPDMVTILPGKQFTANLEIPSGVKDWSVQLKYDSLLVKFNSISGAQAIPDDKAGELLVSGNGGSRSIPITFDAFLPHTSDTIYPVKLSVDVSKVAECETWNATGNILMLADYCGKNIRVVSSTGKKYFLTVKDRSIDFGVGLSGNVRLEVFDYVGNSVLVVSDGILEAGEYSAALNLPVGVYYCRLRAGLYEQVGKVLIAR